MITRICKILFGGLNCGIAALGVWQIISQNIIVDIKRWITSGGTQHISGFGGEFDANARLLAGAIVLLPILFAVCGTWLLLTAIGKHSDDVVE